MTPPIIKNGGKQPVPNKTGNSKFPIIAPILPLIMDNETVIVLREVGNISTIILTITVLEIPASVINIDENASVATELLDQ